MWNIVLWFALHFYFYFFLMIYNYIFFRISIQTYICIYVTCICMTRNIVALVFFLIIHIINVLVVFKYVVRFNERKTNKTYIHIFYQHSFSYYFKLMLKEYRWKDNQKYNYLIAKKKNKNGEKICLYLLQNVIKSILILGQFQMRKWLTPTQG